MLFTWIVPFWPKKPKVTEKKTNSTVELLGKLEVLPEEVTTLTKEKIATRFRRFVWKCEHT